MRKLSFLLACILALSCIVPMTVYAEDVETPIVTTTSDKVYHAKYTAIEPKITGNAYLSETKEIWDLAEWESMAQGKTANEKGRTAPKFKILNDAHSIYILMQYEDANAVYPSNNADKAADSIIIGFYKTGIEDKCANDAHVENASGLCDNHIALHIPLTGKANGNPTAGKCNTSVAWKGLLSGKNAETGVDYAFRDHYENGIVSYEIRIPRAEIGAPTDAFCMELQYGEVGVDPETNKVNNWDLNSWVWSGDGNRTTNAVFKDQETYGTVELDNYVAAWASPEVWGDGYTWDERWNAGTWAKMPRTILPGEQYQSEEPQLKILHDADNIYVLVVMQDTNGTFAQSDVLGADSLYVGFTIDGVRKWFVFAGAGDKGDTAVKAVSAWRGSQAVIDAKGGNGWEANFNTNADNGAAGFRSITCRKSGELAFEIRIPKSEMTITDNTLDMVVGLYDSALASDGSQKWGIQHFVWSQGGETAADKAARGANAKNSAVVVLGDECAHSELIDVPAVDATCTAPGNAAGKKCAACGKVLADVLPALGHASVVLRENEAVVEGENKVSLDEVTTCTRCGETLGSVAQTVNAYFAAYAATRPSIDGKDNDAVWATATEGVAAGAKTSNTGTALAPTFKFLYDDSYVYLLVKYDDPNGTISGIGYVDAVNGKNDQPVGNDFFRVSFVDDEGLRNEYTLNAPAMEDGAVSMNLYYSYLRDWKYNIGKGGRYPQVNDDEEGARAVAIRTLGENGASKVVFELRLPKTMVGTIGDVIAMDIFYNDAAVVDGAQQWNYEVFSSSQASFGGPEYSDTLAKLGALVFEEAPAHVHTEVEIPAVEATCTVEGFTAGVKCGTCGEILTAPVSLGMLEHKAAEDAEWITDADNHWHICATCDTVIDRGAHDAEPVCGTCGHAVYDVVYTIGSAEGVVGETVKVPISITTYVPSAQYAADLNYDTEKLELVGFTDFTDLGLSDINGGKLCDPEFASLGFIWEDAGLYTGILCYAEFKILAESEEPIPVTLNADPEGTCHKNAKVVGGLITVVVPAVCPHENTEVITGKAATCTEPGLTDGVKCSDCGEILTAQEETKALGHTNGEAVIENETKASCTGEGSYDEVVYCAVCKAEVSRVNKTVVALGHTEKTVAGKAATCTETGLTDGIVCSVCDAVIKAQEKIAAKGHTSSKVEVVSATCTEDGYLLITCTPCGETFDSREEGFAKDYLNGPLGQFFDLAAKGHTEEVVAGKAATCTETGLTDGVKCSVCKAVIKAQEEIATLDHSDVYVADETYHWLACSVCGRINGEKALHEGEGTCDICENAFAPIKNGLIEDRFYVNNAVIDKIYALHEYEGKTYYISDGYMILKDGVAYVDGEALYFGADGALISGKTLVEIGGVTYAYENGTRSDVIYNVFTTDDGKTYYIGDAYQVVTTAGETWVNGKLMVFGENGVRLTGNAIVEVNGAYYAFENGVRSNVIYDLFTTDDGKTYYIGDAYQIMTTAGEIWVNGELMAFGEGGALLTGNAIVEVNGAYYAFENGVRSHAVYTTFETADGTYYIGDAYAIVTDTIVWINSEPTYFGADGKMATGTFILNDNVYVNGEMVKAYQAVKVGDVYYYVSDGHKIARSTSVYINDPAIAPEARYYEVDADGIIQLP